MQQALSQDEALDAKLLDKLPSLREKMHSMFD